MATAFLIGASFGLALPASVVLWVVFGKEEPYDPLPGADTD